jgi:replicative DNA helicase
VRRRGAAEASAFGQAIQDLTKEPAQVIDEHRATLAGIDSSALGRSPGDLEVSEFIRQEDEATLSIVPGLINQDDRAIVVAEEGLGKSEFLRQIAMTVAYGIHPFNFTAVPPFRRCLSTSKTP